MAKKINKKAIDGKWNWVGHQIMIKLMELQSFSADEFWNLAVQEGVPVGQIRKNVSKLFRQFKAAGKIKCIGARNSSRNDSALIKVWGKA